MTQGKTLSCLPQLLLALRDPCRSLACRHIPLVGALPGPFSLCTSTLNCQHLTFFVEATLGPWRRSCQELGYQRVCTPSGRTQPGAAKCVFHKAQLPCSRRSVTHTSKLPGEPDNFCSYLPRTLPEDIWLGSSHSPLISPGALP